MASTEGERPPFRLISGGRSEHPGLPRTGRQQRGERRVSPATPESPVRKASGRKRRPLLPRDEILRRVDAIRAANKGKLTYRALQKARIAQDVSGVIEGGYMGLRELLDLPDNPRGGAAGRSRPLVSLDEILRRVDEIRAANEGRLSAGDLREAGIAYDVKEVVTGGYMGLRKLLDLPDNPRGGAAHRRPRKSKESEPVEVVSLPHGGNISQAPDGEQAQSLVLAPGKEIDVAKLQKYRRNKALVHTALAEARRIQPTGTLTFFGLCNAGKDGERVARELNKLVGFGDTLDWLVEGFDETH
jgi:hypothetical protein